VDMFKLVSVTNAHVSLTSLGDALDQMTSYDEVKQRLLGEFVSLSGLVYGAVFDWRKHVIEPFDVVCDCNSTPHRNSCPNSHYLVFRGLDPHTVKPTACVWIAVNREGMCYICDAYYGGETFQEVKDAITEMSKGMRLGWSAVDKSCNVDIKTGEAIPLNIYRELTTGKNRIPRPKLSIKKTGSVHEGVDVIKRYLLDGKLFFMDKPSVKPLIQDMRTMERDAWSDEDRRGTKDKIMEGRHDRHAAMRYVFQWPLSYWTEQQSLPELVYQDADALW
jgi:hypothetical protein